MADIIYYGGSFNPPHIAHLLFAVALRAYYPKSEILVAPSWSHAFGKDLLPYDVRLGMLEAMFDGIAGVTISTIERDLGRTPTYTVDVVRAILAQNPGKTVAVAVGADIVPDLPKWREYDELCRIAEFLVFPRRGYDNSVAVPMPLLPEVSSSEIRDHIRREEWDAVRALVPAAVFGMLHAE